MKNIVLGHLARNKKYVFVFFLLILVFVFGKNIPVDELTYNRTISPVYGYTFALDASQNNNIVMKAFDSRPGEYYRITFNAFNNSMPQKDIDLDPDSLNLRALDSTKTGKQIMTDQLNAGESRNFDCIFESDSEYQNLHFIADLMAPENSITIRDVVVSRLYETDPDKIARLGKTNFGINTPQMATIENLSDGEDNVMFDFYRKNQEFGQVFQSSSDNLATVNLNLHFLGTANSDYYEMTLREATYSDGKYQVLPGNLAKVNFSANQAKAYFSDPTKDNYFRFPLSAHLVKGKYYFVGIKNTVSFNSLNHLRFAGNTDSSIYPNGAAVLVSKDGATQEKGDMNFQILSVADGLDYSVNLTSFDLGMGIRQFSYRSTNYLSQPDLIMNTNRERVYKIIGNFDFTDANLSFIGANLPSSLEYSTDGNTWQKPLNDDGNYNLSISKSSKIYIKLKKIYEKSEWPDFIISGKMEAK
jgi:hypothetical protein